jgi:hypothetical protein
MSDSSALDITGPSPLLETDPLSLDELFDRVNSKLAAGLPEAIAEADLDKIVAKLRAQRERYVLEGERAPRKATSSARRNAKPAKSIAEALEVSLDDL